MMKYTPSVVIGILALVIVGYFLNHRNDKPRDMPIIHTADTVIARLPADSEKIAEFRKADSVHAARAATYQQKAKVADDSAKALEAELSSLRARALADTDVTTKVKLLQAAVDTASATIGVLHHTILERDSMVADLHVQLTAKEGAFQQTDGRRRELEPLVKGLRDSLVKALKPPPKFHWLGVTCGAVAHTAGLGVGCAIGPTYLP